MPGVRRTQSIRAMWSERIHSRQFLSLMQAPSWRRTAALEEAWLRSYWKTCGSDGSGCAIKWRSLANVVAFATMLRATREPTK